MLQSLADAIDIIDAKAERGVTPLFLSDAASQEYRDLVQRFLIHHSFLERLAREQDPPLGIWHSTSKYHSFWHSAHKSQYQHPACGRTYINEDYMRIVKTVGMRNRYRVPAWARSKTITEKVAMGRSIDFWIESRDD